MLQRVGAVAGYDVFEGAAPLTGAREAGTANPTAAEPIAAPDAAPEAPAPVVEPQGEPATPTAARPVDLLAAFVGGLVKSDRPAPFKQLYEMYEAACRAAGEEPLKPLAVGKALKAGFGRVKGGNSAYFAKPRLAVVAA